MVLPSGGVLGAWELIAVVRRYPEIDQFRFVQVAADRLDLLTIVPGGWDEDRRTVLRRQLIERLGEPVRLEVRSVDSLDPMGRKLVQFLSRVAPPDGALGLVSGQGGGLTVAAPIPPKVWKEVAGRASPSWYLDPLVAAQKRAVNLGLLRRWAPTDRAGTFLKTDLFEEANGADEILSACGDFGRVLGIDVAAGLVARAKSRALAPKAQYIVTDARRIAFTSGSIDVVFSNSTLDHFASQAELDQALSELVRILRPGGTLIVTLDNSRNPLYWLLRLLARSDRFPFPLGVTIPLSDLVGKLERGGLEVFGTDYLIHNPRMLSTGLFILLRKLLGRSADRPIEWLLRAASWLDRLPTRSLSACFVAVGARKPLA